MKRAMPIILVAALLAAAPADAADKGFGLKNLDVTFADDGGAPAMEAGTHPFLMTTTLDVNTAETGGGGETPIGAIKDLKVELPAGFAGDPHATLRCSAADFANLEVEGLLPACAISSVIGIATVKIGFGDDLKPQSYSAPAFNLEPPPGVAAKFGFVTLGVPVALEVGVNPDPPYNVVVQSTNSPQAAKFYGAVVEVWGNPADPAHDAERGRCIGPEIDTCPAGAIVRPLITLPRSCEGPLETGFEVDSWQNPGAFLRYSIETQDDSIPPKPLEMIECARLTFEPEISTEPTTDRVESPSGLDVHLEIDDEGLKSPTNPAQSDIKKAVVTLPEGVTANPSLAEGLATCSPGQYASESVDSEPGEGCPEASKIGTVEVETPLLEGEILKGQLFIASQDDPQTLAKGAENPFDSLLALYIVIKHPGLGILVKSPGRVEPDPETGQLTTTFGEAPYELPQFPLGHVRFHLREGGRSPLITPPACGTFTTKAVFTPWANPSAPLSRTASFQITRGLGGGPCPPAGSPPFSPGFTAGSVNNQAGSYSPFHMRLTRRDGDQDLTRFAANLPPGLVAKLAGVTQCPAAAIAAAKARRGRAELASPSCPASSEIGHVAGGAGVGSQLTYVPGKLYLAGPYNGAPLSVAAVVPAVAGPFDVGTVVTQVALQVNPRTGEVRADGAASDPIPHILAGIPLKVRDIRVDVDRPKFTLNPTSCERFQIAAQLWGGGLDVFSSADDAPVSLKERFQAAGCRGLGFKPRLAFQLRGGTKRGGHPSFSATYEPRPGDANLARAVVRLPRSAFLDQGHIRTICTRVQFAADTCPQGAIYGRVRAFTPILDEPLSGPLYLRSSNHNLPDIVADLHGLVDIEAVGRVDSERGGIRTTFDLVPDAPVTKVVIEMQGGKKGLIINSRDLCARKSRATARLTAHNGRRRTLQPLVQASCRQAAKGPSQRRGPDGP